MFSKIGVLIVRNIFGLPVIFKIAFNGHILSLPIWRFRLNGMETQKREFISAILGYLLKEQILQPVIVQKMQSLIRWLKHLFPTNCERKHKLKLRRLIVCYIMFINLLENKIWNPFSTIFERTPFILLLVSINLSFFVIHARSTFQGK